MNKTKYYNKFINLYNSELFSSITLSILGILMVIFADNLINILFIILGSLIISKGFILLFQTIKYHKDKTNISIPLIMIILGIVIIISSSIIKPFIPITFGIYLIVQSLNEIYNAFLEKNIRNKFWPIHLIFSAIYLLIGLLFIFNEENIAKETIIIMGVLILVANITNIIKHFLYYHDAKQKTDINIK